MKRGNAYAMTRLGFWRLGALTILLGLLLSAAAPPAFAQSLDQLRASGALGERYDGLVEVREPGASGAKSVAKEVNAKRKSIYEQRAASQGVSAAEVGKVYAGKIFQDAPKGTWFLQENGTWRQK